MSAPTKVLHVVHSLQVGGLENGLVNLLNRLDAERFKQIVCCLTSGGKFAARINVPRVDLIELNMPTTRFRFPLVRLAKLFRTLSPDIVHTRGWPTVDAAFAASLARVNHIVHGEHGREHSDADGTNWKRNQIRRVVGHLVDRYVIVCDFFRPWLTETCGVGNDKIVYIPNGVDTQKFHPLGTSIPTDAAEARRQLRHQLGLSAESLLVGTVGRLDPVKDFPTLMRGFQQSKDNYPDAKLVIIGDGPLKSDLARLSQELRLDGAVLWLGERRDIPELLLCFDVFVQTSIFEGMSNTILEAMATGLPIVATETGGNPELVRNGENGTLIRVGDVEGLAQTLKRYLGDAVLRRNHGLNSRTRALNHFDLSLMATRYAEMYEALAGSSRKHG